MMERDLRGRLRLFSFAPSENRSDALLPARIQLASTEGIKNGRENRWLKNLKGFVPEEGRGQAVLMTQGEWSENMVSCQQYSFPNLLLDSLQM